MYSIDDSPMYQVHDMIMSDAHTNDMIIDTIIYAHEVNRLTGRLGCAVNSAIKASRHTLALAIITKFHEYIEFEMEYFEDLYNQHPDCEFLRETYDSIRSQSLM